MLNRKQQTDMAEELATFALLQTEKIYLPRENTNANVKQQSVIWNLNIEIDAQIELSALVREQKRQMIAEDYNIEVCTYNFARRFGCHNRHDHHTQNETQRKS